MNHVFSAALGIFWGSVTWYGSGSFGAAIYGALLAALITYFIMELFA